MRAIKKRSPKGKDEINLQALNFGFELVETRVLQRGEDDERELH